MCKAELRKIIGALVAGIVSFFLFSVLMYWVFGLCIGGGCR